VSKNETIFPFSFFYFRILLTVKAGRPEKTEPRKVLRRVWRHNSTNWSPGEETRDPWGPPTGRPPQDGPQPPRKRISPFENDTDNSSWQARHPWCQKRRRLACDTPAAASIHRWCDRKELSGTWCRWERPAAEVLAGITEEAAPRHAITITLRCPQPGLQPIRWCPRRRRFIRVNTSCIDLTTSIWSKTITMRLANVFHRRLEGVVDAVGQVNKTF
jgi:hypothetical protein